MAYQKQVPNQSLDVNKWFIFPDSLNKENSGRFIGFMTKDDITQVPGGFPVGQNVIFTPSRTPTPRVGSTIVGTAIVAETPIKRAWNFQRRDGVEIEMKTYGTGVYFLINGVMSDYYLLKGGFTSGLEFCYAVISQSSDVNSRVMFCNGTEDWYKWTGLYGLYASDNGSDQITISGTTSLADLGFPASGTIGYKGTAITYSGISGQTFTGCSAVPSAMAAVVGDILVDYPVAVSGSGILKSSVCGVFDGRIHARNEIKKSVALYSKLDDPGNWTAGSSDGDGGAKEIEQGGPINAFVSDEKQVYILKDRLIKTLSFIASGTRIDVPSYGTPKPSNDKSTTVGGIGQKSSFAGPNGVFFVTTDKQLLYLYRQDFKDYPQQMNIADNISPTFEAGVHDEAAGIVYNSKVYYAYKQDSHSSYNDTVIIYDLLTGLWSTPIVGWNVSDWTVINGKLRYHSSINPDTYELTDDKIDGEFTFGTTLRTWNETFGSAENQKRAGYAMIEIYLQENSEITATILYDENGYRGQEEFTLNGSATRFRLGTATYNPFGASAFGEERFGSNSNLSGMNKYRFFLELKSNIEFYNLALQLSTNNQNCNYELIRFGIYITQVLQLTDINLMIAPENVIDNLNLL